MKGEVLKESHPFLIFYTKGNKMEMFTTHIWFIDDTGYHKEEPITADELETTIKRLCNGPAALMGIIKEVKIVDSMDRICVHIIGREIVFPKLGDKND